MSETDFNIKKVKAWFAEIDAKKGLGMDLYEAVSQLVPSISIELIITDETSKAKILIWREDKLYGPGWHVPGGVLRFKETMAMRAEKVLEDEIGTPAKFVEGPLGVHEIFNNTRDIRGHFIAFVFAASLQGSPPEDRRAGSNPRNGQWQWFRRCPDNLIRNQDQLRAYF